MKHYLVIALTLGGIGNKIFNSGDTVSEHHFPEGHAESLVNQGFLSPISSEEKDEQERLAKEEADAKAEAERIEKEAADKKAAEAKAETERIEKEAADKKSKEEEDARILAELEKEEADKKEADAKKAAESKEKK